MNSRKEELRQHMRRTRTLMMSEEVNTKSEDIAERLIAWVDWQGVKNLHIYTPIPKLNEVGTSQLIKFLEDKHPNIDIAFQSQNRILLNKSRPYDLVIVPTLAFDIRGYRLGWGGGFYDRFLASQSQAKKIGLCFESGFVTKIPGEPHDIRLDCIITDTRIHQVK